MRTREVSLLVGIVVVLGASVAMLFIKPGGSGEPGVPPGIDLVEFTSQEAGLAISHPSDWERLDTGGDPQVVLAATPNGNDSLLVRTVGLNTSIGPDELGGVRSFTQRLVTEGTGIDMLSGPEEVRLGGLPGWHYLYRFSDGQGRTGVHSHYFLFRGDQMIVLVFQALPQQRFEQLADVFDAIATSFRVLEA